MGALKSLLKWETSAYANVKTNHEIVELEARRIRLLYEYLIKHGFNEEQSIQIVSGNGNRRTSFL